MAAASKAGLARIGFRRDIKLFLAALVGYFIVFILMLLISLQSSLFDLQQSVQAQRETVADFAMERAVPGVTADALLTELRAQSDVIGVTLETLGRSQTAGSRRPARSPFISTIR